jgi:hypothetical protein
MDVYAAVRNGDYENKLQFPAHVAMPAVLRKVARDLTKEELATLAAVRDQYELAKEAFKEARDAYSKETSELTMKLKADLEAEHGLVGHPKADMLWSKAYEHGHSSGFAEVVVYYDDLADLLK